MYRSCTLISVIALCVALAGCGGGGGSASNPTTGLSSYAGTWTASNLGLPQNQLMIGSGGQVFVAGQAPPSVVASNPYYTRIGTCDSSGHITFSGVWTYAGSAYQISGTGTASSSSDTISMTVTVLEDGRIVMQDAGVSGVLYSDTPPPVPDFPADGGGFDIPPAVPL